MIKHANIKKQSHKNALYIKTILHVTHNRNIIKIYKYTHKNIKHNKKTPKKPANLLTWMLKINQIEVNDTSTV